MAKRRCPNCGSPVYVVTIRQAGAVEYLKSAEKITTDVFAYLDTIRASGDESKSAAEDMAGITQFIVNKFALSQKDSEKLYRDWLKQQ